MGKESADKIAKMLSNVGVARDDESPSQYLARLLKDKDAITIAVDSLLELTQATVEHWDKLREEMVLEVDGQTRTKANQLLLAYSVGDPVKRQQILSGKIPTEPVDRAKLKEEIDKKIAQMIRRDDVSLSELVQARKTLDDLDKGDKLQPGSEEDWTRHARQIHGVPETTTQTGAKAITTTIPVEVVIKNVEHNGNSHAPSNGAAS